MDYKDWLFAEAISERAKIIVELGVGEGHSTISLLNATIINTGHLYSVDVRPCRVAHQRVLKNAKCWHYWTFIQAHDLIFIKYWSCPIDLLFIDTSHKRGLTFMELQAYSPYMNGPILLHDTLIKNNPEGWDVKGGIDDFLAVHSEWKFKELLPEDDCGLGLLWKESNKPKK